jgi:large subunit ribosomal protein L10
MRAEKQLLLDEIKGKIDESAAMIVVSYEKLPPNHAWDLRDQLTKVGSFFEVVRKRVFLKAVGLSGLEIDESLLAGHIGVVFVKEADAIPPAKVLLKFSQEHSGVLQVLCGQIEGKLIPGSEVVYLSKLPGINEMRAQFIALLVSPMTHTLSVMEAKIEASTGTEQ